ncbi:MAG TPA: DUF882 domain-containing protein [Thermoanaerobaculia bacterium]|nr:DUF882 domain-containing protein [Thermoanaerobaculia bacterium]
MKSYRCLGMFVAATLLAGPAASPRSDLPKDAPRDPARAAPAHDTRRAAPPRERQLRLYNTHTGERLDVVYRRGDAYVAGAVRTLERHLRDHRTGDVHAFDPRLFDVLSDLAEAAGMPDGEFQVISGYRSPKTNEMLRRRTTGVAKSSLHMRAQALDVRLPGIETSKLRDAALALGRGGVGYYAHSDFIHVDVGPVRRW